MTVQDIKDMVAQCDSKSKKMMEENPELKELQWEIKDVPYKIFNEFRQTIRQENLREEVSCGDRVYCRPLFAYGSGCTVYVWSVPVKIKTHVEVEELQET